MGKKILTFRDTAMGKKNLLHKSPSFLENIKIEKVLVSKKIKKNKKQKKTIKNYKYFIGYLYNAYKVTPLQLMLPKTSAYVKKL